MRMTSFMLSVTVCLALVGAFVAGHYVGESDARDAGADTAFHLDASRSAEAFGIANSVRQALRESKPSQAELLVVRYAAQKARSLAACAASPECAAAVGRLMPAKAQLDEALAAERALRNQR